MKKKQLILAPCKFTSQNLIIRLCIQIAGFSCCVFRCEVMLFFFYLRCRGLDGFDFGLALADTLPFGEFVGDFFDFGDC